MYVNKITKGSKVLTQAFNFIATIEAIIDCDAIPVICPVDENLHLDIKAANKLCEEDKDIKAIIIVHMLGMGGPINELLKMSESRNIPVLEDNCECPASPSSSKLDRLWCPSTGKKIHLEYNQQLPLSYPLGLRQLCFAYTLPSTL